MNWANHPTLYQLTHWWHWLAYGQNSVALATLAGCIGTVAVVTAGYFAYRTFTATVEQLTIAHEEASRAKAQYFESVRPHLSVSVIPQSNRGDDVLVTVKNTGVGRALNIEGEGIAVLCSTLPPDAAVNAAFHLQPKDGSKKGSGVGILRYSSIDGRRFRTEAIVAEWRTVIAEKVEDISGPTEPAALFRKIH
jgi:hypothetical protein